ncbi:GlxA family transcriptional regulator [Marinomonas sp. 15G1-11]|uniref:GlxA family transcriptional regulator n=1 Tax=Marinomonas phaeophyticola TaxID=3004091 RepID=A0ABT4JUP5_9GAMM|nr:GlxA family transcriptional regulator [Marinomonas sp. 15G1-11]MCZ2721950.1 GlxA family transcriptional regulator [Marinomonas sp. 15G1-11]
MTYLPSDSNAEPKRSIGFLLLNNFTMMSLASAVEVLRMANQLSGEELYSWYTITLDGEPISASDGIRITPDASIQTCPKLEVVMVAGGIDVSSSYGKEHIAWLKTMERQDCLIGGMCTGAYLLAEAGLLDGYECSIHWEYLASLQEHFPKVHCTNRLFSIDRDRMTCSGGTVPLDMMLYMIKQEHGFLLSSAISEMFICDRMRDENDRQKIPLRHVLGTAQPKLIEVVSLMEANIEEVLGMDELAKYVNLSRRQLERLFQKHLQCSPSRYYLKLRLLRARQLLKQSTRPIVDIAIICGFASTAHFSKCYREQMGIPPSEERASENKKYEDNVARSMTFTAIKVPILSTSQRSLAVDAFSKSKTEATFGSVSLKD